MFHTSPNLITDGMINEFGIAGSCLFFSDRIYQMSNASIYTYEADFNCVPVYKLHDDEIIADIAERFNVDLETAELILDGSETHPHRRVSDDDDSAYDSWWLQGKRGECAVKMGFDGCEDTDEQGAVYIVPMLGRESELKLV